MKRVGIDTACGVAYVRIDTIQRILTPQGKKTLVVTDNGGVIYTDESPEDLNARVEQLEIYDAE